MTFGLLIQGDGIVLILVEGALILKKTVWDGSRAVFCCVFSPHTIPSSLFSMECLFLVSSSVPHRQITVDNKFK